MGTDGEGSTPTDNIGAGIENLTSDKGYSFKSRLCVGEGNLFDQFYNDYCWDWWPNSKISYLTTIKNEIDNGRPFLWSVHNVDNHSLAAWGYRDDRYVITYNTWDLCRDDWYYATYDNNGIQNTFTAVLSAVPGGGQADNQVVLDTPAGGESFYGGELITFVWDQWGTLISSVDFLYSSDGGATFVPLQQQLPSVSGWNQHDIRLPNVTGSLGQGNNKIRFRIVGYDHPQGSYIAGDGTKENATIIPDYTGPVGSVTINGGAVYATSTLVTLTLSATDTQSGVDKMCISNTSSCSSWEPYATTKTWTLPCGDGKKTVYAFSRMEPKMPHRRFRLPLFSIQPFPRAP